MRPKRIGRWAASHVEIQPTFTIAIESQYVGPVIEAETGLHNGMVKLSGVQGGCVGLGQVSYSKADGLSMDGPAAYLQGVR